MRKLSVMMSVDEFIDVLVGGLKGSLERDFGEGESHIVDMLASSTTYLEMVSEFMDGYWGTQYGRDRKDAEKFLQRMAAKKETEKELEKEEEGEWLL